MTRSPEAIQNLARCQRDALWADLGRLTDLVSASDRAGRFAGLEERLRAMLLETRHTPYSSRRFGILRTCLCRCIEIAAILAPREGDPAKAANNFPNRSERSSERRPTSNPLTL